MNRDSPTFCVMPHMGLAIQNKGDMCVCHCNSESYMLDGKVQTIDKITVDEIWQSPTRKMLIEQLDSGQKHHSCQVCWDAESAGKLSVRQELSALFSDLEPDPDQPKILILKPGNTCNAACRICGPDTSTSWYRDAFELEKRKSPDIKFNNYIKDFEAIKNSFNPDSPNMWPVLDRWYEKLKFLDIYGGEPMMIPGLWTSLQQAIAHGFAKDIDLRISTNGSHWNEEYMHILSQFKSADVGISIDSHIKAEFEYMRHKLDYDMTMQNSKKIIDYIQQHDNMTVRVCCTVSVLNIWNLIDINESLSSVLDINVGIPNFVYFPDHHDIRHLPKDVKRKIIDKLKNNASYDPVINYMNQVVPGCEMYWPKFCLETDKLDRIRNQNFKAVFPEWYAILEPFWDYKKPNSGWYGAV